MRHLLLHAAGNMRARALRLHSNPRRRIARAANERRDWQQLIEPGAGEQAPWWAFPPLVLTARYYPAAILGCRHSPPWSVIVRRCCDRSRDATACDVSWSKIRIPAFPGIEWSSSLREAVRLRRAEYGPAAGSCWNLSRAATVRATRSPRIPWYGLSHGARILRWIFSHPPRVQTMHSVRSALGHEP